MRTVAIAGASDLGATLARKLAEAELAARVVLVDPDEGRAKGKALDLRQSGPVEGYDTHVEGAASFEALGSLDALVVTDVPTIDASGPFAIRDQVRTWVSVAGKGLLVFAGLDAPSYVEAAVEAGLPRQRVLGSYPTALLAALRRELAGELRLAPSAVTASIFGLPPDLVVCPARGALAAGVPLEAQSPLALRRALDVVRRRPRGPVALATAACRVLAAAGAGHASVLPVFARLDGEYATRNVALAVPARLGSGRIEAIVEVALEPIERVGFDNAAQRRLESRFS